MRLVQSLASSLVLLLLSERVGAVPAAAKAINRRASTCNTASDRACWSDGFNISTDYETSTPSGSLKTFTLEITEHDEWTGPDGQIKKSAMLINNQFPGPTLVADWGDTIQVTVTNNLSSNGTGFHWHGLRMLNTNIQDGVNGVTECPIAPGHSKTYTFTATQYGTTWYHSHYSAQYANGVWGTIVINGPASADYDIDLGVFPINDWYYGAADALAAAALVPNSAPPPSDNLLFNGTNIGPSGTGGAYANVTLTPLKKHRLRLVNPGVENHFMVSLVGHNLTVIATDLVPVKPFVTNSVFLAPGQRYDVIIDASQDAGNYWFNATYTASGLCGSTSAIQPAAIFHYEGATGGLPTAPGTAPTDSNCQDATTYTPVVSRTAPVASFSPDASNTLPINLDSNGVTTWKVNGSAISVTWGTPVLEYVINGTTDYPAAENLISLNTQDDDWAFWVMENQFIVPHPLHLHGHDFLILGNSGPQGSITAFTEDDISSLNTENPTRRDVTMLPAYGWVVVAFKADNPGAWLFHCHIAWHVSGGLSVDFLEAVDEQLPLISSAEQTAFQDNCAAWNSYYSTTTDKQIDSGLKARDVTRDFKAGFGL